MQLLSKLQQEFSIIIQKVCIKFTWRGTCLRIAKTILRRKNKGGRISLSQIKSYYKAIVIKTVQYWWRVRHLNQRNKIENPEIDPPTNTPGWFFTKVQKQLNGGETVFSTNSAREIGHPEVKINFNLNLRH